MHVALVLSGGREAEAIANEGDGDGAVETNLDDDEDRRDERHAEVEVWECHLPAIAVFGLCRIGGIGHMGGIHWQGFAPESIRAALALCSTPREDRLDVAQDVAFMGRSVADERNARAARSRRK